ncbi:hypothetical protein ES702_00353 [subsurface metagenome]
MLPEKLSFLKRFDVFYLVMVNSAKEDKINERDFYSLIRAKVKTMDQERRDKLSKKTIVKVIGAKKGDLKY